jgi:hypothetical protein
MKKKILSILPLLLFTAMLVNAQTTPEATTYRGAFAPAPTPMWTENWTNWNPNATPYGTGLPVATKTGVLGNFATPTTFTWVKDSVYLLTGPVYLDSLCTLVIQPGTIIKGDASFVISSLIIQRGATLIANGTPCEPIVFTSSKAVNTRIAGDWGGITLLGRANTNQGTNVNIEGIGTTEPRARYGGNTNTDNSGSLKYVRIEFAGYALTPGNELNSLTFGGVGSGTTIDYVQVSFGNDDSYEWFGGTVDCRHLIAYRGLDDDFDTDFGYSGLVQFGLAIKDPAISDNPSATPPSTSEGFESDNNNFNSPNFGGTPITNARFYNITQIGAYRCGTNLGGISNPTAPNNGHRRGARIRRNSSISIVNSILMNNFNGLNIEDAPTLANYNAGTLQFKNNIIAMDSTFVSTVTGTTTVNGGLCKPGQTAFATNAAYAVANTNTIINTPCDLLTNAWSFLNPDYRPNGAGSGAASSGCDLAPGVQISNGLFVANATSEILVDVFENGIGNSNGTITITIPVLSGWTYALIGGPALTTTATQGALSGTSAGNGGNPFDNTKWNFRIVGGNLIATTVTGYSIPSGGSATIGITAKRNTTTPNGTNQNLSATVSGGSDIDGTNNGALTGLAAIQ